MALTVTADLVDLTNTANVGWATFTLTGSQRPSRQ